MMLCAHTQGGARAASRSDGSTVRTCVACGAKKPQSELIRIVVDPDGAPVVDWRGNLGGRGAHVCVSTKCVTLAVTGKKLGKSLKCAVHYGEKDELLDQLRTASDRQLETLLRSGNGARRLAVGTDASLEAVGKGRAHLVVLAKDSASLLRYSAAAAAMGVAKRQVADKVTLGELLGRVPTGIVAVLEPSLAKAIIRALDRRASFE